MGQTSGFIFSAANEPTVYWVGDTILTESMQQQIQQTVPEIIITHSSGAVWGDDRVLIVMDATQTIETCKLTPLSKVVAIHMEALDHGTVTREDLRKFAELNGIGTDQLIIPTDGENVVFNKSSH
jgi:hypothetical protein